MFARDSDFRCSYVLSAMPASYIGVIEEFPRHWARHCNVPRCTALLSTSINHETVVLSARRRGRESCSGAVVTSDVNSFECVIGYEERVEDS